jgi:4-diphosphocytidyl-2-C-methyl-D-erythritol kinase
MRIKVFAPAKVNLTLHVTGQRQDGYHLLDSLIAFAPIGDDLTMACAAEMRLAVAGSEAQGVPADARNLVWRAVAAHQAQCGATGGVEITLEKHLPAASGIGGGSSDAAAGVRGAMALGGSEEVGFSGGKLDVRTRGGLAQLDLLALGADVPMCYRPAPIRVQGIGEAITPVSLPPLPAVLINPRVEVSTPAVFRALASKTNPPSPDVLPNWPDARALIDWLATQRNDLEAPAAALAPVIGEVLGALRGQAALARMSGSGATCFGLFYTEAEAESAAASLARAHPEWWLRAGVLGDQTDLAAPQSL